jgi:HPr kinase/phosphorylase
MTAFDADATIHASAVLVGGHAVLIRGRSGSGKSRLAFDLILAGRAGIIAPTQLIGDDRIHLFAADGTLVVRPAESLAGLLEVRGLGIRKMPFAPQGPVNQIVDLDAADATRLPAPDALEATLNGIKVPRIPVGRGIAALPLIIAALITSPVAVS